MDYMTTDVQADANRSDPNIKFPQAVGHRGYNAKYPENTMCSFKAAVEVGAHGLETDVHISKDGVVVLSHVSYPRIISAKNCYSSYH